MSKEKRIAAFLDLDGVITDLKNYNTGSDLEYLTKKEDIRFFEKTAESIGLLNEYGILVIIITNKPQIAKGLITEEEVEELHKEIIRQLEEQGAKIDAIYYCPHHPKGVIEKYSIVCDCRKPGPGMILMASYERNIDLAKSYVVGDRISDIKAGNLAGCKKTIGVRTGYACDDGFKDAVPDEMVDNLYGAVHKIINEVQNETFH